MLAAEEPRFPVVVRQCVDADPLARGGMDELVLAEVDAAVGCALLIGLKKDEVAGHKLLCALCSETELVLLICCTWNGNAMLLKDVLEVAGAVESLRCCTAEYIGRSHVRLRRFDDIGDLVCR